MLNLLKDAGRTANVIISSFQFTSKDPVTSKQFDYMIEYCTNPVFTRGINIYVNQFNLYYNRDFLSKRTLYKICRFCYYDIDKYINMRQLKNYLNEDLIKYVFKVLLELRDID